MAAMLTEEDIRTRFQSIVPDLTEDITRSRDLANFDVLWTSLQEDYSHARQNGLLQKDTEELASSVAMSVEMICTLLAGINVAADELDEEFDGVKGSPLAPAAPEQPIFKAEDISPDHFSLWTPPSTILPVTSDETEQWTESAPLAVSGMRTSRSYPTPSPSSSPEDERISLPTPAIPAVKTTQSRPELSLPSPAPSNDSLSPCSPSNEQSTFILPSPTSSQRSVSPESSVSKTPAPRVRKRITKREQLPTPSRSPSPSLSTASNALNSRSFALPASLWLLANFKRPYPADRTRQSILLASKSTETCSETSRRRDLDAWFTYARKRIGWTRKMKEINNDEEWDHVRRRAEDLVRELGGVVPTPTIEVTQTASGLKRSRDEEDEVKSKKMRNVDYTKSTEEPQWVVPKKEEEQHVMLTFNTPSSNEILAGKETASANGLGLTMDSSSLSIHKRRRSDESTPTIDRSKRRRVSESNTGFATCPQPSRYHSSQLLRSVSAPPPPPAPSHQASSKRKRSIEPRVISLSGDPDMWRHFDTDEKPEHPEHGTHKMGSYTRKAAPLPRFGHTTGPQYAHSMFPPPQIVLPGDADNKAFDNLDSVPSSLDGFEWGLSFC